MNTVQLIDSSQGLSVVFLTGIRVGQFPIAQGCPKYGVIWRLCLPKAIGSSSHVQLHPLPVGMALPLLRGAGLDKHTEQSEVATG